MSRFNRPESKKEAAVAAPAAELIHEKEDLELVVDIDSLNKELMDQPLLFKKYTTILAKVSKTAKITKIMLDELESELHLKLSSDGTGKRVKEIEAAIALTPEIKALKRELIDAEELQDKFTGIVKAFHSRGEVLKDLSANRRKELLD